MKLIVDLEKKSLRILENERSIFRGEYGADKLELYINKTLENEYPTITSLLSNGRKIGAYSTDSAYGSETIDGVAYTIASFTLSKENGFTLSEGQMQITIWMNSNGKKEAIGNVLLNVVNTTAFDDGDIIISGDVEGTLVNYKVELENLGNQVNGFNGRLNNVETNKADKTSLDNYVLKKTGTNTVYGNDNYGRQTTYNVDTSASIIEKGSIPIRTLDGNISVPTTQTSNLHATSKQYVDNNIKSVSDRVANVETNKLDKTTASNTLYGIDNSGDQTNFEIDNGVMISGTIPKRDNNGQLEVPLTPTGNKHATSKKYVDDKIANLINSAPETLDTLGEIAKALEDNADVVEALNNAIRNNVDKTSYQSVVDGGTYPRLMKYDDNTLYLFTDNAYSISKDGGKTWSERVIICSTEDGDIYVNGDSSLEHPVNDVANAFGIVSPNNDGRIIVFYRATNRDTSYFSIRYRVSDTTGHNFGNYKIVVENDTGLWEPFADKYPETGMYGVFYSKEFTKLGRQDICYRNFSIDAEGNLTFTTSEKNLITGGDYNQDNEINYNSRRGMFSFTKLKSSRTSMWIWENSVELTATKPRPMIIEYCYGRDKNVRKLFVPDENKSAGAPYITTLDDGRIVISFQTDQDYQGIQSSTTARNKQWVVYVSKCEVNLSDNLTIDDFVKINYFPYGENEYGCWGSVQNIDGQLYAMATLGKNTSETTRTLYGNIIKKLDVENIAVAESNGVSEEQVMGIVINNAIKSSATHTPDDTTIPTTATVQTMINESSSGSGGESKFKLVCEYIVGSENEYDIYIENVVLKKNKLYCLMIKSNVNISLIFNSGTADDLSISYCDENGMFVYITYTFNDENSIYISTQDIFYTGTKFEIYELGDIE